MHKKETLNYYIVSLKVNIEENNSSPYNIDHLKSFINKTNYLYRQKNINVKTFLYFSKKQNIQILISSDVKTADIEPMVINDLLNNLKEDINKDKQNLEVTVLYSQEINKETALELILEKKKKNDINFDLIAAVEFNEDIKEIAKANFYEPPEHHSRRNIEDNFSRPNNRPIDNLKLNIKDDVEINKILSNLCCKEEIEEEFSQLNRIQDKLEVPINYVISSNFEGLEEKEVAEILISKQYNKDNSSSRIALVDLNRMLSPKPMMLGIDASDQRLPPFARNNPIIVESTEIIEEKNNKELIKLAGLFIENNKAVAFIIDQSKVKDKNKLDNNLYILQNMLKIRKININSLSNKEYIEKISKEIDKLGFKLNKNKDITQAIKSIKGIYGENIRIDRINNIAEQMVFKHILNTKDIDNRNIDLSILNNEFKQEIKNEENGMDKLNKLVGLKEAKDKVYQLLAQHRINQKRKEQGFKHEEVSRHIVLKGNPGTGKTIFSRILAQIFKEEGILDKGHIVETSRDKLIGKYVGWTAKIVKEMFEEAKGGVLFIDEAHALAIDAGDNRGFGSEAISTIVKYMEEYRYDTVVIFAGYPKEMDEFINTTDSGLLSRVNMIIDMKDFEVEELMEVFSYFCNEREYIFTNELKEQLSGYLNDIVENKDSNFGNARFIRKLLDRIILIKSQRLIEDNIEDDYINILDIDDLNKAIEEDDLKVSNSTQTIQIGFRS